LWFALLQQRAFWEPDEGRYAEIPREMVASGDWVTPRLNGLLYLEKPPLQYWATALAFEVFGQHQWTARLWIALTGLLGVLFAGFVGRTMYGSKAGGYAAAMLASSVLYFAGAHVNTLDVGLTLFLELTVFSIVMAWRRGIAIGEQKRWLLVAWAAMALAVLSKGVVGIVLPAAALAVYSVLYRDFSVWRKLAIGTGLPLFLAIAAPWFVAIARVQPDFLAFFFVHEHFTRFLTNEHQRFQPWWGFVPILLVGTMPWTLPMLSGLRDALRRRESRDEFAADAFLAIWCVVVFVFFSLSHSKLFLYILPMLPALALLGGRYLSELSPRAVMRQLAVIALIAFAVLVITPFAARIGRTKYPPELIDARALWLVAASGVWFAGSMSALITATRRRTEAAVVVLALSILLAQQVTLFAFDRMSPVRSSRELARQLEPQLTDATTLYSVQTFPQSLPVYLKRTLIPVETNGELAFGIAREPHKSIPTVAAFAEKWRQERDAVAVMRNGTYAMLAATGLPMAIIASDPDRVAVRRP
jgi:4-amino-4-deoxy-L-arabinose transferase-like glycosyltransferase